MEMNAILAYRNSLIMSGVFMRWFQAIAAYDIPYKTRYFSQSAEVYWL